MKKTNIRYLVIDERSGKSLLKPSTDRSKAYAFAREGNKKFLKRCPGVGWKPAFVYKEWKEGKLHYGTALN